MTPLPQTEQLTARVATKVIPLPGSVPVLRPVPRRLVKIGSHRAVNPLVRGAFYVFVFSLLFEWPDRPIPIEIPTLIGFVYLAFTLLQLKTCYRHFPRPLWLYAAYLLGYTLLCVFVEHKDDAIKQLELMIQIFFLMWSGYNLMRYERIAKTALMALVVSCSLISAMQLLRVATTEWYDFYVGSRYSVLGQNPNNLANNISLGLAALMGLAFGRVKTSSRAKYVATLMAAIMLVAIFDTGSRGALLAFGIGFVTFAVRGKTLWARVKSVILVLAVLTGLVVAILQTPSMVSRFKRSINENNMAGREQIFPAAWDMFMEKPLIGWGPIDNQYEVGRRVIIIKDIHIYKGAANYKGARDTHNMFLDVLTSTGLFGAVPLFTYIIICMLAAWRARHGIQGVLPLTLVIMVVLINMSGNWIASKLDWLLMAYALASAKPLLAVKPRLALARPRSLRRPSPAFF